MKPDYEPRRVQANLDLWTWRRLLAVTETTGLSRPQVVQQAVKAYLARQPVTPPRVA